MSNTSITDKKDCPKCGAALVVKGNMFAARDYITPGAIRTLDGYTIQHFSGLVCVFCNVLYDNPEDSFMEFVRKKSEQMR